MACSGTDAVCRGTYDRRSVTVYVDVTVLFLLLTVGAVSAVSATGDVLVLLVLQVTCWLVVVFLLFLVALCTSMCLYFQIGDGRLTTLTEVEAFGRSASIRMFTRYE